MGPMSDDISIVTTMSGEMLDHGPPYSLRMAALLKLQREGGLRPTEVDVAPLRERLVALGDALTLAVPPKVLPWARNTQWIAGGTIRTLRSGLKALPALVAALDARFPPGPGAHGIAKGREEARSGFVPARLLPTDIYTFELADHLHFGAAIVRYHEDYLSLVRLEPRKPMRTTIRLKAWIVGRHLSYTFNLMDMMEARFKLYGDANPYRHGHWYTR